MAPTKGKKSTAAVGPRKSVAVRLLRTLSDEKYLAVPNPAETAADLRLIADCIAGEARWSRAGKYPPEVQEKINFFAALVERHRAYNLTVNAALNTWARELTRLLGRTDDPDAEQEFRDAIASARKAGRKSRTTKSGK